MTIPHLEDYQDLMRRTQVHLKATLWCVKRVATFLDTRPDPDTPIQEGEVDAFIEGLGRELEDWQVTQRGGAATKSPRWEIPTLRQAQGWP